MTKSRRIILFTICVLLLAVTTFVVVNRNRHEGKFQTRQSARELLKKGIHNVNKNKFIEAFNQLTPALSQFKSINDSDGIFTSSVYLNMVYSQIGQPEKAYSLIQSVEGYQSKKRDYLASIYFFRSKGMLLAVIKHNYKASAVWVQKAIDMTYTKSPVDSASSYIDLANMSEIYVLANNYPQAILLLDSVEFARRLKDSTYLSEVCYCRGMIFYNLKQYDKAYKYLNRCVRISHHYGASVNELASLDMLRSIDSSREDMSAYIHHDELYNQLNDKTTGSMVVYKIALMQEQHKAEMLKQENARKQTAQRMTVIVMAFIIIVLVQVIQLVRRRAKTKRALTEMERQKMDAEMAKERMTKEFLELKLQQGGEMIDKMSKENITMSLKLAGQKDTDSAALMTQFERSFRQLESGFVRNIESKFPSLTRNDIRLIGMLKMGMTSQEISSVLNITIDSLNKSRYRLRKKLGLTNEQNLETFLNSFG